MRRIRLVLSGLLFVGAVAQTVAAQEPVFALSDRAPRFLVALATGGAITPRVVDASAIVALRRDVTVDLVDATLGQALREVGRQIGIHFVYSADVVPVNTRVHLTATDISAAGALNELLMGKGLDVLFKSSGQAVLVKRDAAVEGSIFGTVTESGAGHPLGGVEIRVRGTSLDARTNTDGTYHIGHVPIGEYSISARRLGYKTKSLSQVTVRSDNPTQVDFVLEQSPTALDQVVVTGTMIPTERKALPNPITVVTGEQIAQQNLKSVDQVFEFMVPGGVREEETPGIGGYVSYSVRGTSSVGSASTLKVLVDGVVVQDPAYINNIDPSTIDHIEVITGPEASTIYGSGAISGVMQIFTKHGAEGSTHPVLSGTESIGMVDDSKWNPGHKYGNVPLRQDYSLNVNGGGTDFGYNVGGSWQGLGAWVPYAAQHAANVFGAGHTQQGGLTVDLSARYRSDYSHSSISDAFNIAFGSPLSRIEPNRRSETQWTTYSLHGGYTVTPRWTHSLTLGYDGHNGLSYTAHPGFRNASDTLNSSSTSNWYATSLAYNTSYAAPLSDAVKMNVTAGTDYTGYIQQGYNGTGKNPKSFNSSGSTYRTDNHISGFFGQTQLAVQDQLFLTFGIHGDNSPGDPGTIWTPRAGVSYVRDLGGVMAKARLAYGSAIVAPDPSQSQYSISSSSILLANPNLQPNRQTGYDTGLELYFGTRFTLEATYFNQIASDLIDLTQQGFDSTTVPGSSLSVLQYQNIGKIKNTGIEFTASYTPSSTLTINGNFGSTNSTVQSLAAAYNGDYKPGDRLLDVPKWTTGGTAAWSVFRGTTLTGAVRHSTSWREVDFVKYFGSFSKPPVLTRKQAWVDYPAYTLFNLGVTQALTSTVSGFVQVDNASNNYAFQRINLVEPMGRVTSIGLKWRTR